MNISVQSYIYPTANFKSNFYPNIYTDRKNTNYHSGYNDVEGDYGNYTFVHLTNGKSINLEDFERFLEEFEQYDFVRIRKSFLINLNFLKDANFSVEPYIIMENGKKVEISRRRKAEFQKRLQSFKQESKKALFF
ncbi:MAG: LytTR family DNA-binding domain-containing protein [Emticicia sp.]|nr:LytTR family DNA-binding domain-containing protein [Emticicia sp.]